MIRNLIKLSEKIIKSFLSTGLSAELSTYEFRRTLLVNKLTFLSLSLAVALLITNAIFEAYSGLIIDLIAIGLIFLPVFYLNKIHQYRLARLLFIMGTISIVSIGAIFAVKDGRNSEIENLLIAFSVPIVILLDKRVHVVTFLSNVVILLFIKYYKYTAQGWEIGNEFFLLCVNMLIIFTGIYFFVSFYKTQLINALTRAQRLNNTLKMKEGQLLEINRTKDKMFTVIAHDLRSPIALFESVLNMADEDIVGKEEFNNYRNVLKKRLHSLNHLLDNLLTWAKSQLGGITANPTSVELKAIIKETIKIYQDLAQKKKIRIMVDIGENSLIYADENHMKLVVRNLVHNALKFTPSGGVVDISSLSQNGSVQLTIADSGVGMDDENIEGVMTGLTHQTKPGTNGESGSGLGLSLCMEMLSKNNASMKIRSEKRNGTAFDLQIPAFSN
ncbi:MAG: HAMP domain-containing sensor histidine kinase [Cyclobacteriaceae bacterium]